MRFLLFLTLASPLRAYDLPALPAYVAVSEESPLCGQSALSAELSNRFLRVNDGGSRPDLVIACRGDRDLIVDVRRGSGAGIARFRIEASNSSKSQTLAYLAANAVAKDKEVIEAVADSYFAHNADLAAAGSEALGKKEMKTAHTYLNYALESDLNLAPIYFGLYKAAGEDDHPRSAKWYLAAFLKASGTKAEKLSDAQILPLISGRNGDAEQTQLADRIFAEYKEAADRREWHRALSLLREIVMQAPWYEPAYHALARSYEAIRWKRVARHWRERAIFVNKLNEDKDLAEAIEQRVNDAL